MSGTNDEIAVVKMDQEAAEFVSKANAFLAEHEAEMADVRAKRDQVDEMFRVKEREAAEERRRQREERRLELTRDMLAAEDARLQSYERLEKHVRAAAAEINKSYDEADRVRDNAKVPRSLILGRPTRRDPGGPLVSIGSNVDRLTQQATGKAS